jgi:hypothetical protein
MKRFALLVILVLTSGCTHFQHQVALKLQPTSSPVQGYQLDISEISNDPKWQIFNDKLDSISSKLDKICSNGGRLENNDYVGIANELQQTTLPEQWPYIATVKDKDDKTLQIKIVGASAPDVASDAETEEQRLEQKYRKLLEGSLMLLADIDLKGTLKSFYLNQKQKNMVSMLFGLPGKPVSLSDNWHPSMNLIELGNGFIVDQPKRLNNARIIKLEPQNNGDEFAHIVYVSYEGLEGKHELKPGPEEPSFPFTLNANYLAYGVFSVKHGYWVRFVGVLKIDGSGQAPIHSTKIHTLKPILD